MTTIIWTEDAAEDLIEIVSYQKTKYGLDRAKKVYSGIQNTVQSLTDFNQNRITSYNVCYTKLLRIGESG